MFISTFNDGHWHQNSSFARLRVVNAADVADGGLITEFVWYILLCFYFKYIRGCTEKFRTMSKRKSGTVSELLWIYLTYSLILSLVKEIGSLGLQLGPPRNPSSQELFSTPTCFVSLIRLYLFQLQFSFHVLPSFHRIHFKVSLPKIYRYWLNNCIYQQWYNSHTGL